MYWNPVIDESPSSSISLIHTVFSILLHYFSEQEKRKMVKTTQWMKPTATKK